MLRDQQKHLYWRAGFGLTSKQYNLIENYSIQDSVQLLFDEAASDLQRLDGDSNSGRSRKRTNNKLDKKRMRRQDKKAIHGFAHDWIARMAGNEYGDLLDKMALFWHGHFACVSKRSLLAQSQLKTIRKNALGNFRDLVLAMAKDASMIKFLNNKQNKKKSPNENFARELMELFTVGRGHYTEKDIKEAARAFTGWTSFPDGEFRFNERQHDFDQKTFMGESGNFNGEDVIDIILEKKATSDFLCKKVYRYFVNEKINDGHVKELSAVFYDSNYDIKQLMFHLFLADWFYDAKNIGAKIKSPVELLAGITKMCNAKFEDGQALWYVQKALGQTLFNPPNVAGWAGGKSWIDNSTLMLRLNLPSVLFLSSDLDFRIKNELEDDVPRAVLKRLKATVDFKDLAGQFISLGHSELVDELADFLLQKKSKESILVVKKHVRNSSIDVLMQTVLLRLMSLPEYQLC